MLQGVFPISMKDLKEILNLKVYCEANDGRVAESGYAGDLLSWVMGNAPAGCVWFTVMTNVNVIAVAHLADAACVIVTEGRSRTAEDAGRCAGRYGEFVPASRVSVGAV